MSYRKIFWGLMLVLIGVLFILKNTGVVYFNWHTAWHLWPAILILWGIALIPIKDIYKVVLSLLTVVVCFFAVEHYGPKDDHNWNFEWNDHHSKTNDKDSDSEEYSNVMSEDYDPITKYANLKLNIGAGNFGIRDTTAKLIELKNDNDNATYSMTAEPKNSSTDSLTQIKVSLNKGEFNDGNMKNNVIMKLNPNPIWDMELSVGAADVNFDLSGFKTRNIKVEGGASDIKLQLGSALPLTDLRIEAGAASITIRIPESSGCDIVSNTFLASKDFKGFSKMGNQHYQTSNYSSSSKKISINLQAGVAKVEVIRY